MFIVWRGYGFFALAVAVLPLAACAGLMDYHPQVALLAAGLGMLGGGIVCLILGRRGNRVQVEHSMYWIPLEFWGLIWIVFGAVTAIMFVMWLARRGGTL